MVHLFVEHAAELRPRVMVLAVPPHVPTLPGYAVWHHDTHTHCKTGAPLSPQP